MSGFLLVRVDDRLLHGQVTIGWGSWLRPGSYWIVDDQIAADALASALYEAALPEGAELFILETAAFLERARSAVGLEKGFLLLRGLEPLRRLCEKGFLPSEVNLGGLHHRMGTREFADYLFLGAEDLATIRWLIGRGIVLYAQDLPTSPRLPLDEILSQGEERT